MRKYLLILLLLTSFVFTSVAYLSANRNITITPSHLTLGTISTANTVTLSTSDSPIATSVTQKPNLLRSSNGTLIAFWINAGEVYSQISTDGGSNFTKIDGTAGISNLGSTTTSDVSATIDSADNIYVIYTEGFSLYYRKLTQSSGYWLATDPIVDITGAWAAHGGVLLKTSGSVIWSSSIYTATGATFVITAAEGGTYTRSLQTGNSNGVNYPYVSSLLINNKPNIIYFGLTPSRSIRFRAYNGSSWNSEIEIVQTVTTSNQFTIAKDSSNNIHLVYVDNGIKYKKYNGTNWTSADATLSTEANDVDPKISIDTYGNPLVIWSKYNSASDNDLVYKRFNGTSWDTNAKDLINNGLLNRHISTPETMNSSTLKYIWTEGTANPYNVNFNSTYLPSYKAHITSSTYTVSSTDISNIPFNTSKTTFLSNITKEDLNITFDDSKISDPVVSGDSITSTAEDGTTVISYSVTVNPDPDINLVSLDKAYLTENLIKGENPDLNNVTKVLTNPLPILGPNGSTISWSSDKPSVLSSNGSVINRPLNIATNENIILIATITKGLARTSKEFGIVVLKLPNTDLSSNNYTIDLTSKVIEQIPLGTSKNDFLSAILKEDSNLVIDDSNVSDPVKSGDTITIKDQYGNILGVYDISVLAAVSDSSISTSSSSSSSIQSSISSSTSSSSSSETIQTSSSSSTSSISEILIPSSSKATTLNTGLEDSTTQRNRIIVAVLYFLSLLVLVSVWAYRKARRQE